MSRNPMILGVRFLLELAALAALGLWGWMRVDWVVAILLPALAAAMWAVFRATADAPPQPPVAIPGVLRLALEWLWFGLATVALVGIGAPLTARLFAALVVLHYALSWDRIARLVRG